ncbi:hypothetical protein EAS54_38275 [Bradyrhizobium guangzhouense]|nr:hypothetical protein EAS54_38275 [Bradyrhizobium guangzhouense]
MDPASTGANALRSIWFPLSGTFLGKYCGWYAGDKAPIVLDTPFPRSVSSKPARPQDRANHAFEAIL